MSLQNEIKQKIFRGRKSRSGKTFHEKKLAGYFVAGLVDGNLGIGFSLLHPNDRYDVVRGVRTPGFGIELASGRAVKCAMLGEIKVPSKLMKKAIKFAERCQKYYKDIKIPDIQEQPQEELIDGRPRRLIKSFS